MSNDIFFLGLDQIGTSIALAFSERNAEVKLWGHDPDPDRSRRAKALGAFDRLVSNPKAALKTADIVILDVPAVDIPDHLEMLNQTLKPQGTIIDTSLVRTNALKLAETLISTERDYIGATPIIGPEALLAKIEEKRQPRADLFQNGLMALTLPTSSSPKALSTGLDLAAVLGATPFFIDADEHDGITVSIEWLPTLIGVAILQEASKAGNWEDIQRMAGATFANISALCSTQPPEILGPTLSLNREILLVKLNKLMDELNNLRVVLSDESGEALNEYLRAANAAREQWLNARYSGTWPTETLSKESLPAHSVLGKLFGIQPRPKKER